MTVLAAAFAFGIAFGAARTVPLQEQTGTRSLLWFLLFVAWLLAYAAGRRRRPVAAVAMATSIAEATATATGGQASVNVFVAPADLSRITTSREQSLEHERVSGVRVPDYVDARPLSALEQHVELVDDMDPVELQEDHARGLLE